MNIRAYLIGCDFSDSGFRKELSEVLYSKNADKDQIKKVYRKMALCYHPDVCDPSMREESTRIFIELQKAYTTLMDKEPQEQDCLESGTSRDKWESQLSELKRRSYTRKELKEGSWGCRMRANHN
ncbi:hypothetical protein BUALT_Bualt08G0021300 [Buddleja alternifolia]|uniref:J domain-containing protein n=1 Tax=Buddleja alternifolia TaxID=168488 RepID=A0AAV6X4E0_9LAMI|nr:hypothetical protein BUALT_Bualt08G0021300 [Buddleja alternifolia]